MLPTFFPKATELKSKLEGIVVEEIERRKQFGLSTVEHADLQIVIDSYRVGGSADESNISLNLMTEFIENPELIVKYGSNMELISIWFDNASVVVGPENRLEKIYDLLKSPSKIRSYRKTEYPDSFTIVKNNITQVKRAALDIIKTLTDFDSDLPYLREAIRHELEHLNPAYENERSQLRKKRIAIEKIEASYLKGERSTTNAEINRRTKEYLQLASLYLPDEEVRAHMAQYALGSLEALPDAVQTTKWHVQAYAYQTSNAHWSSFIFEALWTGEVLKAANKGVTYGSNERKEFFRAAYSSEKYSGPIDGRTMSRFKKKFDAWHLKFKDRMDSALKSTEREYRIMLANI